MKKKFVLFLFILLLKISGVSALTYNGCDYSTISRMKSLVTNVNITYDYRIINNKAYFDVTLTNVFPGSYFTDLNTGITYTYENTNNGEITIKNYEGNSGTYKFYSSLSECPATFLGNKYYKFPTYNIYYNSEECKDIPNFSLCQKWVSVNYSSTTFKEKVGEYKESLNDINEADEQEIVYDKTFLDRIVELYINNYYYFLVAIIFICCVIMIINRRKNRFKL